MTRTQTTYGPDGVTLVETVDDNGDGTGVRTTYLSDGTVDAVEELTGLPIPAPEPETEPDVTAALAGMVEALAPLGPSSTSTQQRAALLAVRGVLDAAGFAS